MSNAGSKNIQLGLHLTEKTHISPDLARFVVAYVLGFFSALITLVWWF